VSAFDVTFNIEQEFFWPLISYETSPQLSINVGALVNWTTAKQGSYVEILYIIVEEIHDPNFCLGVDGV